MPEQRNISAPVPAAQKKLIPARTEIPAGI